MGPQMFIMFGNNKTPTFYYGSTREGEVDAWSFNQVVPVRGYYLPPQPGMYCKELMGSMEAAHSLIMKNTVMNQMKLRVKSGILSPHGGSCFPSSQVYQRDC